MRDDDRRAAEGTAVDGLWIATGAVAGLAAGTLARGQVARLSVRGGEPDEAACRRCAARLPVGPALRCECCGAWIGAPLAIELTSAAVVALIVAANGLQPSTAAFALLAVLGVALAQIDTAVQRLPDRLTLPAYPAVLVLLTLAAAAGSQWPALLRALLAAALLGTGYLLLGLLSAGQVGGGDVKLAGLLGLPLGWLGWPFVLSGTLLAFAAAAVFAVGLLARRRASLRTQISFGPFLLTGALLALAAAR
jgi:leader peptidase (prepilin peptidase) / N-methyltransferase